MAVRRYIHVQDAAKLSVQILSLVTLSPKFKNKILTITIKEVLKFII